MYNLRFKKILEEVSTTKTISNSHSKSHSRNKIKKEINKNKINEIIYNTQLKRASSDLFSNKQTDSQTIVAGKYHLSISKLEKQFNNIEKYDPYRINIVKNNDEEIIKERILLSKSQSMNDISSSSSKIILPPIKLYKRRNNIIIYKKRENSNFQSKNNFVDMTIDIHNDSLKKSDRQKANVAISQIIKNFYLKQKNIGYKSLINKHNNRYYKLGRRELSNIINK